MHQMQSSNLEDVHAREKNIHAASILETNAEKRMQQRHLDET